MNGAGARSRSRTIDPAALDDTALAAHLDVCRRFVSAGYRRHFELHGDDLLPVGLLITRCQEWGIDPTVTTAALGAPPQDAPASTLSPWMLVTGYDLDSQTGNELGGLAAPTTSHAAAPLDLDPHVAEEQRGELATLVTDARNAVRLRDDNGAITAAWPMGLLRRAMLEAGRRLFPRDGSLALDATVEELSALLDGRPSITADELESRRRERAENTALDAPQALGPEFAIPPLDALPRPLSLIGAAQLATAEHMFTGEQPVGIGTVSYTGRAVVVDDAAAAMSVFAPGDVIVTTATSPSWNALLVHAGALVTANGGLVSHAAVTARELGIPAIIGDATARRRIQTGCTVTVDPVRATVSVVDD